MVTSTEAPSDPVTVQIDPDWKMRAIVFPFPVFSIKFHGVINRSTVLINPELEPSNSARCLSWPARTSRRMQVKGAVVEEVFFKASQVYTGRICVASYVMLKVAEVGSTGACTFFSMTLCDRLQNQKPNVKYWKIKRQLSLHLNVCVYFLCFWRLNVSHSCAVMMNIDLIGTWFEAVCVATTLANEVHDVNWRKLSSNQCFVLPDKILPVQITSDDYFANISQGSLFSTQNIQCNNTLLHGLGLYNTDIIFRYFVTPQMHVFPSLLAKHVCSCVNSSSAWMCRLVDVTEQKRERFAPFPNTLHITHFSHNSLWVSDSALHKSSHEVWMYEYIYIYMNVANAHTHTHSM